MVAEPRATDRSAVLDGAAYERLRRATETHREDLVVRLSAEVGVRPGELTRVRPVDVVAHGDRSFLRVRDADGAATREAYLPLDVAHDLAKYGESAGLDPTDSLVDVSVRRVQMLVAEVAARAAEATGNPVFEGLSTRDLRRYFARRLLVERGVDPRVVLAVGPYDRVEQFEDFLDPADREAVVAAFERERPSDGRGPPRPAGGTRRLRSVTRLLREASAALDRATTAETIRTVVCERLAEGRPYRGAFVVDPAVGERVESLAGAGPVDRVREALAADATARAGVEAAVDERRVRTVPLDAERTPASSVVVPLVDGERSYGALCVVPTAPPGDAERDALSTYGSRVAAALASVRHRRLLLADTVTEVTLTASDGVLAAATDDLGCTARLEGLAPVDEGSLLHYVTVRGVGPEAALTRFADAPGVAESRLVSDRPDGALLELVVTDSPARALVERGGTVRDLRVEEGTARLVGDLPSDADVRAVVDAVREAFPSTRLIAKRKRERSAAPPGPGSGLDDRLTDRQATVVRAAYYAGYFEWPRESTAEELADSLNVSSPTLHNHLRRAQQKLLGAALDEE